MTTLIDAPAPYAATLPDPHAAEVVRGWAADLEALADSEA